MQNLSSLKNEKNINVFISKTTTYLMLTMLQADSAGNKLIFLNFFRNGIWHFMQIVSLGDNLHEVSNPILKEK